MYRLWQVSNIYTCIATVTVDANRDVTSVTGTHLPGKNDSAVRAILYLSQFNLLPTKLQSFFPHLQAIWAQGDELTAISRSDFAPFYPSLIELYFYYNKITSLSSDVFQSNPNLQFINIGLNPIKSMGTGVLKNLSDLRSLDLERTKCYDGSASNDRSAVLTMIPKVLKACPPLICVSGTELLACPDLKTQIQATLDAKMYVLLSQVQAAGYCGCGQNSG